MTPRVKRAGGRQNIQQRLLTYEDISRVLTFINNFAEDHAISLPGRVPGFRRGDLKLLPCSTTKQQCFDLYKKAMEGTGKQQTKYFCISDNYVTFLLLTQATIAKNIAMHPSSGYNYCPGR